MLHLAAIPAGTLDLLTSLSARPGLACFSLAGGTSLALRFGHRLSVDLDFFTTEDFDKEAALAALEEGHTVQVDGIGTVAVSAIVDGVKVDLVTYRHALLAPPESLDGLRLLSLPDVTAMKLSAVTNRGAKKDFYDFAVLIDHFGIDELVRIYTAKFPRYDAMIMLRSLAYFEDAEEHEDPVSLTGTSWGEVKSSISLALRKHL